MRHSEHTCPARRPEIDGMLVANWQLPKPSTAVSPSAPVQRVSSVCFCKFSENEFRCNCFVFVCCSHCPTRCRRRRRQRWPRCRWRRSEALPSNVFGICCRCWCITTSLGIHRWMCRMCMHNIHAIWMNWILCVERLGCRSLLPSTNRHTHNAHT